MKQNLKKWLAVVLAVCLLPTLAMAKEKAERTPYPDALKMEIVYEEWTAQDGTAYEVGVPVTCREEVNAQLRAAQEALFADAVSHVTNEYQTVQTRAAYRISGQSWAGFLLTARVVERRDDTEVDYEVITTQYLCQQMFSFDLATGKALTLSDVFEQDSAAWDEIRREINEAYTAFYADQPHNQAHIDALCSQENLAAMPFLPSAGRLALSMPLWPVVEGKYQLCTVSLYYAEFQPWMTTEAQLQTDNSQRPIAALTYDDGPQRVQTEKILKHLDTYGASASFFIIGRNMNMWPDLVRQQLDGMHSVGSHTYKHKYEYQVKVKDLREDRELCLQKHRELTGQEPFLFRAPGGNCDKYMKHEVGWPIILWNDSAGDTGNNNRYQLAQRIIRIADDGDILLMHDFRKKTADGTGDFLKELTQQGFLFATVEELLCLHGITIEPNHAYRGAYEEIQ